MKEVKELQILHFITAHVNVCLDLKYIQQALPLSLLEEIPNSPRYLTGLLNLSGESIPVIDLAIRLGLTRSEPYPLDMPILLCTKGTKKIGLLVDKVEGLKTIRADQIQMHHELDNRHSPFLGVISIDGALALLMNIHYLVSISFTQKETAIHLDDKLIKLATDHYE